MNTLNPAIDLERQIGEQIYNALQGPVVEEVLRKTKISSSDVLMKTKLTFVRYGLIPTFSNLQNPMHYELHYN